MAGRGNDARKCGIDFFGHFFGPRANSSISAALLSNNPFSFAVIAVHRASAAARLSGGRSIEAPGYNRQLARPPQVVSSSARVRNRE